MWDEGGVWASDHFRLLAEFEVSVHPPGAWL